MSDLTDLYQEVLIEHGRKPHNRGELPDATHEAQGYNPLCGDRVQLQVKLDSAGRIVAAMHTGQACAICTASTSIMTERIKGMDESAIEKLHNAFHDLVAGDDATTDATAPVDEQALGELVALAGVKRFPMRVKCATLPWHTLKQALAGGGVASNEEE